MGTILSERWDAVAAIGGQGWIPILAAALALMRENNRTVESTLLLLVLCSFNEDTKRDGWTRATLFAVAKRAVGCQ